MNIFARELAALLEEHGKSLGSLYNLHSDTYQIAPVGGNLGHAAAGVARDHRGGVD